MREEGKREAREMNESNDGDEKKEEKKEEKKQVKPRHYEYDGTDAYRDARLEREDERRWREWDEQPDYWKESVEHRLNSLFDPVYTLEEALDKGVLSGKDCQTILNEIWGVDKLVNRGRRTETGSRWLPSYDTLNYIVTGQRSNTPSNDTEEPETPSQPQEQPKPQMPTQTPAPTADTLASSGVGDNRKVKEHPLHRGTDIYNQARSEGIRGAAAQATVAKALTRRAEFLSASQLGDETSKQKIANHLRKSGMRGKVSVRVDKSTGKYHVTDASGNTTVVNEQYTFVRTENGLMLENS
jgi:hypothetical protein